MGLLTPVELVEVSELGAVHFIAIGGSGMNGVASALLQLGVEVSGSDRQDSKYLRALEAQGARVHVGHDAAQLGDARTVVASSAIREDNPELAEARRRGLRVLHRSAALGSIMLGRRGVAVAGTHGKTTTTAMISHVLSRVGADPSYVIGGALTGSSTGGHIGGGDAFVVEADESDGSFLQYPAEIAVVTNVDPDHLSNWGTAENYADGFLRFVTGDSVRLVVISADDPGAVALTERLRAVALTERLRSPGGERPTIVTYGESETADVRITDATFAGTGSTFVLDGEPVRLNVPGAYNVWNAAATYAVARDLGADPAAVRAGAGDVRRDLSSVPADRHRGRHPGLRRLRPPPDRGRQHPAGGPDRGGGQRSRRGLLPAAPVQPDPGLLARARRRPGARRPGDRDGRLRRSGGPDPRHRRRDGGDGRGPGDRGRHLRAGLGLGGVRGGRDRPPRRPGDHGRLR